MSRHELKNVGLARGPSIHKNVVIDTSTGNIDLAPTILHLLGFDNTAPTMDGRILEEALVNSEEPTPSEWTTTHEAAANGYGQRLRVSHVGQSRYLDWGNRM